jgi:hypothetical protein
LIRSLPRSVRECTFESIFHFWVGFARYVAGRRGKRHWCASAERASARRLASQLSPIQNHQRNPQTSNPPPRQKLPRPSGMDAAPKSRRARGAALHGHIQTPNFTACSDAALHGHIQTPHFTAARELSPIQSRTAGAQWSATSSASDSNRSESHHVKVARTINARTLAELRTGTIH